MSLLANHVWSTIALATAFGFTASCADAQHGILNLPFEARWGTVNLSPASYHFSAPMQLPWPQIIELSGNGKTVSIQASLEASQPQSDHSYLSLLNIDGTGTQVVREFHSGAAGKVFTFPLPKPMEKK